ncbi:hypothetical protein NQ318_008185 [Aromia moschata]|uniref:PIN domain-containing protein n=1 Tax=Aromia moschata TaxID=1265417 RepID=A0AAV8YL24_9CUCU|nr:hypothetical protein NQ318_008185 [Aromia moschata]
MGAGIWNRYTLEKGKSSFKGRPVPNIRLAGRNFMSFVEPCQPVIYIPWMVLMELDYMKDQCSDGKLKKNITNSVKFIHNALEQKNPRMLGQTVDEAEKQKYIGKSPDDKILSCCLQAGERYEHVILVSNDVNLKNKAMVNDVTVCSTKRGDNENNVEVVQFK